MLTDLLTETVTTATDILEGLMLALVGVKLPRRQRYARKTRNQRRAAKRVVLNERAMLRLSGKLFRELPRDEAITILNDIKQYAK